VRSENHRDKARPKGDPREGIDEEEVGTCLSDYHRKPGSRKKVFVRICCKTAVCVPHRSRDRCDRCVVHEGKQRDVGLAPIDAVVFPFFSFFFPFPVPI
jgi:hypothetical protein